MNPPKKWFALQSYCSFIHFHEEKSKIKKYILIKYYAINTLAKY